MTALTDDVSKSVTTVVIGGVTFKLRNFTSRMNSPDIPYSHHNWDKYLGVKDKSIYDEFIYWQLLQCDLFNTDEDTTS